MAARGAEWQKGRERERGRGGRQGRQETWKRSLFAEIASGGLELREEDESHPKHLKLTHTEQGKLFPFSA